MRQFIHKHCQGAVLSPAPLEKPKSAAGLLRAGYVAKGKSIGDIGIGFSVQLHVRINEIIQPLVMLFGAELKVSPHRELETIYVISAKEIIFLFLVLPGFRDVHWYPPVVLG